MSESEYLVSAIVSVYNCERFIEGCLQDLEDQTIASTVEIIVINSGSQQNEEAIIRRFQKRFDNIVYIKTEERETIYKAWNRGIKIAAGKYITNANADDRHRKDAFEIMVTELEKNQNIDLLYGDSIITETENDTYETCHPIGYNNYPLDIIDRSSFLRYGGVGCQPMWRKKIHDVYGYFDERLKIAGDYEFWLRISRNSKFKHIKDYTGLYLRNPSGVEHSHYELTLVETLSVMESYLPEIAKDKKLLTDVKYKMAIKYSYLGHFYLLQGRNHLSRKPLISAIVYDWKALKYYVMFFASFIPKVLLKYLLRRRKINTNS